MDGKKGNACFFVFLLVFLLLLPSSFGQVAVSIQSVKAGSPGELYTNEVEEFKIVAINLGNERIVGERFKAQAASELSLLEKNRETQEQLFVVPELLPSQAVELHFFIKAQPVPSEKAVVSVSFGQSVFSDLIATSLRITPSPLEVTIQPKKQVIATGELSSLLVSFANDSNKPVQSIRSQLLASEREDSLSRPFETAELLPQKAQENVSFEFWPRPLATGPHELVVQTVFSDSKGGHLLDHRVEVQVRETTSFVLFLVGALLVAGILYWLWMRTVSKPPVKLHSIQKEEKK